MQDRLTDLGEIQADLRELAKTVLMHFMFVQGNDWFVVPFTQDVGTLCRVESLIVHDVFGGRTVVERADKDPGDPAGRWSMFSTAAPGVPGGLAEYFILPPTAATTTQSGEVLESVKFIRDEIANMVWAVEHTTQNGIGRPWAEPSATDRGAPKRRSLRPPGVPLVYRNQNTVPHTGSRSYPSRSARPARSRCSARPCWALPILPPGSAPPSGRSGASSRPTIPTVSARGSAAHGHHDHAPRPANAVD